MLLLSPGNTHDVVMGPALLAATGGIVRLLADKAYDTNPFRIVLAGRLAAARQQQEGDQRQKGEERVSHLHPASPVDAFTRWWGSTPRQPGQK